MIRAGLPVPASRPPRRGQGPDGIGKFAPFHPDPVSAMMNAGGPFCPLGRGHNGFQTVVGALCPTVVGFSLGRSRAWPNPQRHNGGGVIPYMCAHTHAIKHVRYAPLCRCGVVPFLYLTEKKEENKKTAHNGGHNGLRLDRCGVCARLVNLLKFFNKWGFGHA